MKTPSPSAQSVVKSPLARLRAFGLCSLFASVAIAGGATASAAAIDLGAAAGYSVLAFNGNNTSDSAIQGGPIGIVQGDWTQSGGGQTNTQQPTTVFLSPGFKNNGPSVETTVYDAARLTGSWSAATQASANFAALTPTQTLGSINSNLTISESAVGNYVFNISNINLNHPASLTLSAPAGSSVILNISGSVVINGAGGTGLLIAGGLTTSDVVYNFTGGGSLTTAGGGNGSLVQGIVLDTGGSVNLHPGEVQNEVIAGTFTSSSGALVTTPPMTSVPETSTMLPLLGVLGLVMGAPMIRRKLAAEKIVAA